jgi:radical SAM superfamily enzyme YgiQ (UPF0313 family)
MKVLLITPTKFESEAAIKAIDAVFTYSEPLGMAYLAAALHHAKVPVDIVHSEAEGLAVGDLANRLAGKRYDVIGMNTDTPSWGVTQQDVVELRRLFPDALIVAGGPHANALQKVGRLGELFEQAPALDVAVYGEGEQTLVELVKKHRSGDDLTGIPGTAVRDGEAVRVQPSRELSDIDSLPFPALDLLPLHRYSRTPSSYKRTPVRSILAARGCPFSCVFCDRGAFGKSVRQRSVDNVIAEVSELVRCYGTRELRFWDDVLTMREDYVIELCKELAPFNLTWSCNGRVKLLSDRMLGAMKRAGCWEIDLGIEAANNGVLEAINKRFTKEEAADTIRRIKEHGMEVRTFFILGLPTETRETVMESIDFTLQNPIDYATFYLPQAYPGTRLYEIACEQQALATDYSTYLITGSMPSYRNPNFKEGELAELQRLAYRRFYRRPSYILRRALAIRSLEDIKRCFKARSILKV